MSRPASVRGGGRDDGALGGGAGVAAGQLEQQAALALAHGPVVVGREEGLHDEGQVAQQRLIGAHPPVVGDDDVGAVLGEGPDAAAVEVALGVEAEAAGAHVGDGELPAQGVGQPALGVMVSMNLTNSRP